MQDSNNKTTITYSDKKNEEPQIRDIFFNYLKYWKLFVASILVCIGIALLYLRYVTNEYTVKSNILIKDEKKGQTGIDLAVFSDLGILGQNGNVDNEIEILRSKTLMELVVDSLDIRVLYYAKGNIKNGELYKNSPVKVAVHEFKKNGKFEIKKINSEKYIIESRKPKFVATVSSGEIFDSPWGILSINPIQGNNISDPIEVIILKKSELPKVNIAIASKNAAVLNLSMKTTCPDKGIDIVNTLVDIYNDQAIEDKDIVALTTIRFIDERLSVITGELEKAEKEVEDYKKDKNLTDLQTEAGLFLSTTSEYDKKISEVELESNILSSIKSFLSDPKNEGNIIPVNMGLTDPTIISLIDLYNKDLLERNKLAIGMKAGNPKLKEYDDRITSLKQDLLKGLGIAEQSLKLTSKELKKQENLYSNRIKGLSTQERETRELYRQKEIKETLFIYLLQKREETSLSLALSTPNAKIIDRAYIDPLSVKPKPIIILLISVLIGFMIPIIYVYLKDLMSYKLRDKEELIKIVKAPFLGEIFIGKGNNPLPVENVRSAIAEKFRIIGSNLSFILGNEKNKVVMVTSTFSGEGKSFFSRNLAFSHASYGKRILLIDLDIRKSVLNKTLNLDPSKGIAMYLSDPKVSLSDIIITGLFPNMDLIPTKIIPPNPAELLASDRLKELFDQLKGQYDMIIVDTAPIGLVADVFRINEFSNACIYVTRIDHTHKSSLKDIQELYADKKLHNLTCVLNGVSSARRYGYAYGNYYHENH